MPISSAQARDAVDSTYAERRREPALEPMERGAPRARRRSIVILCCLVAIQLMLVALVFRPGWSPFAHTEPSHPPVPYVQVQAPPAR